MTVFDELNDPKACERHLARLRETFSELGVRAFLVRDTSNIQWLTAFDDVFDEEAAHALYVCPDHAWLHTDSRYVTACENAARLKPLEVSAERETHAQFAAKRWGGRAAGAADALLGIEDGVSLAEYRRLQKAFAEADAEEPFVETDGVVVGLRAVKVPLRDRADARRPVHYRRRLRAHRSLYAPGHDGTPSAVGARGVHAAPWCPGPGVPLHRGHRAQRREPARHSRRHHAGGRPVRRARFRCPLLRLLLGHDAHGLPRRARLGDAGGVGRAAGGQRVRGSYARSGVTGKEAHERAEEVLAAAGFGGRMGHGLGHGVGIDIHEEPVLAPRNERPLVAGNVVTVEPGIYLPGKFGMRLEDFGVVTDNGFDVFTNSTHDLVVI